MHRELTGALGGALVVTLGALGALAWSNRQASNNATRQLDALLDRVATAPNVVLAPPASEVAPVFTPSKAYISDEPYMDTDWNNFLVPDQEEPE